MMIERAAFIWGYDNSGNNVNAFRLGKLLQYINDAKTSVEECEIKIWGPPVPLSQQAPYKNYYVGDCTRNNLLSQCFDFSYGYLKGTQGKIRIVIDDFSYGANNSPPINPATQFDLKQGISNYQIPYSEIANCLNDPQNMTYLECVTVVRGDHSSNALQNLFREDRMSIVSRTTVPSPVNANDQFCSSLNGTYEDIKIAFYIERDRCMNLQPPLQPQTPQILPP